jgi:hypothetical protein
VSALTEIEIFDCIATNFRLAAEHAELLAVLPKQGPTYRLFREELKLIEGACRQASVWREDTRWLQIGLYMAECHKRAGDWIRRKHPRKLFLMLAQNLRAGERKAVEYRDKATGTVGAILPDAPVPHRDSKPVHFTSDGTIRPSGLIIPAGVDA